MIIEIQIPDEIFVDQYGKSVEKIQQQLIDSAGFVVDPKLRKYHFTSEQMAQLRNHFGPNIKDAEALIRLIEQVGTIRLMKAAFKLDSDQITQFKEQAYYYAEDGEPNDSRDDSFSKKAHEAVIQRHAQKVLNDALNYILGLG